MLLLGGIGQNGLNDHFPRARYNADGTFQAAITLEGALATAERGVPVVLDGNVPVFSTKLHTADSYVGASLTSARRALCGQT